MLCQLPNIRFTQNKRRHKNKQKNVISYKKLYKSKTHIRIVKVYPKSTLSARLKNALFNSECVIKRTLALAQALGLSSSEEQMPACKESILADRCSRAPCHSAPESSSI